VKEAALALVAQGVNDCEISRRIGVPRRTIMDWRRPTYVPRPKYPVETCPRCWRATRPIRFTPEDYTELLGLYLGDGCISDHPRTQRLRISLDAKYQTIIGETQALVSRCFPGRSPGVTWSKSRSWLEVWIYSQHLACLIPQHAPGKKHDRVIELEQWQRDLVTAAPWGLLRGLVRSDGCSFINRTGPYKYLSYGFTNRSREIIDLFTDACDLVNVSYRVTKNRAWQVRINRRESVARMVKHVGIKA
jgi:Homeodomain-like domain